MDSNTLLALADLLKPPKDKESDEELDVTASPYATPGSIGAGQQQQQQQQQEGRSKAEGSITKDIWSSEEVSENQQYEYEDSRPQPEYDIVFKQSVGTEDVFLGMGAKNPTTSSCENMVVKIKLPDTDNKDIELDITDTFLDCRAPKYRLGLHLPHKVASKKSKAKWLSDLKELQITLLLDREYDFLYQS